MWYYLKVDLNESPVILFAKSSNLGQDRQNAFLSVRYLSSAHTWHSWGTSPGDVNSPALPAKRMAAAGWKPLAETDRCLRRSQQKQQVPRGKAQALSWRLLRRWYLWIMSLTETEFIWESNVSPDFMARIGKDLDDNLVPRHHFTNRDGWLRVPHLKAKSYLLAGPRCCFCYYQVSIEQWWVLCKALSNFIDSGATNATPRGEAAIWGWLRGCWASSSVTWRLGGLRSAPVTLSWKPSLLLGSGRLSGCELGIKTAACRGCPASALWQPFFCSPSSDQWVAGLPHSIPRPHRKRLAWGTMALLQAVPVWAYLSTLSLRSFSRGVPHKP